MKLAHKIAAFTGALVLAATALTGCNFGKDDFYGTWQTGEFARPSDGHAVRVTFYFSGKSENLTSGDKAYFYEIYENLEDDLNTFWWGTYSLGNNSDVTNGTLTLRYLYGIGYKDKGVEYESLSNLISRSSVKKLANAAADFDSLCKNTTAPRKFDQYDATNKKCSDVEKFDFKLDGAVAFQGYTQMVCTASCQWWEDGVDEDEVSDGATRGSTKSNPADGTSWGAVGTSRSFSLTNDNGQAYGDTFDTESAADSSANLFGGALPQFSVTYTEVGLTPEK